MRNVLRGLRGPHEGAVFVLGERTVLGRAADADVQVVEPEVSRQHAKLTVDERGRTELVDLSSDNGTFVDDVRVARRVLLPGHTIRVGGSVYRLETLDDSATTSAPAFEHKLRSSDSFHRTREILRVEEEPAPRAPVPRVASPRADPPRAPKLDALDRLEPEKPDAGPSSGSERAGRWDPHRWIVATTQSGRTAAAVKRSGDRRSHVSGRTGSPDSVRGAPISSVQASSTPLLGWSRSNSLTVLKESMEYRELGRRLGRGIHLTEEQRRRHVELDAKFRIGPSDLQRREGRSFNRFACALPAHLHWDVQAPEAFERVLVADISPGGARLADLDRVPWVGERGLLAIEATRSSVSPSLVVPTVIAWVEDEGTRVGLKFIGPARMTGRWSPASSRSHKP